MTNSGNDLDHLFDVRTEELILGAILTQGETALEVARQLTVEDFTSDSHGKIFAAILYLDGEVEVGADSVAYRLDELGHLESVGGLSKLVELEERAVHLTRTYLARYVNKLRTRTRERTAARLTAKLNTLIETGSGIDDDDVGVVFEELRELRERGTSLVGRIEALPNPDAAQEPVAYIIEPELPLGSVISLTGDSGSGKSTLATAWVKEAVAAGRPALILDRENPRSVVADRMNRLGLVGSVSLRWWGGWSRVEAPEPGAVDILGWVKSYKVKPLIVIDSLAAFNIGDENSAADMRRFMHQCRRLADFGATVIVIHHDGKADSSRDFRGSSDFKASVDQAFHVTNIGPDGLLDRLTLRCFKSRFGFTGSLVYRYAGGMFVRDERREAPSRAVADQLTMLLRQNPGLGSRAFEDKAVSQKLPRQRARDFLADGVLARVIRRESAARGGFRHYLEDDAGK